MANNSLTKILPDTSKTPNKFLTMEEFNKLPDKEKLEKAKYAINCNLFDNPMVNKIKKEMKPELKNQLQNIGKTMYENIDYTANMDPFEERLKQSAVYIISGLTSGLLPSQLTKDELQVLKEVYGETWYIEYGYSKDDIKS